MLKSVGLWVLTLLICLLSPALAWARSTEFAIDVEQIGRSAQWKKLLFYAPTWFRGEVSLIDDPSFFLSHLGKVDPVAELNETLNAFTQGSASERQKVLCQFPARRMFLEQHLNRKFDEAIQNNTSEPCKRLRVFSSQVRSERVSLIFSSHYPGNPASLFGHTLLKFKRKTEADTNENALLDYGVNHAAYPTAVHPLLFPLMGLSGFFPGKISMLPYYVKVQEYNNSESRDLWEYDLNLTPNEVALMLASVFELSTKTIDYYYFDDNCSLLMIALIDVGRPNLDLVSQFRTWVIPGDTIRVVANVPSLVTQVHFRPSNIRKYLTLESRMSEKERSAFKRLLFTKSQSPEPTENKQESKLTLDALNTLSSDEKTTVLDTALEYIDAQEKLSPNTEPLIWKTEREILLKLRAEQRTISAPLIVPKPEFEAPHRAYPPTRVSVGLVGALANQQSHRGAVLLGWRPALHSLENPVTGMAADLGISFLNIELTTNGQQMNLREFTPLSVESIPIARPHIPSPSWAFELGYKKRCFEGCRQTAVNFEWGRAFPTESPDGRIVARAGARVGDDVRGALFVEPSLVALAHLPLSQQGRWVNRIALSRLISLWARPQWNLDASSSLTYRPSQPWEIQTTAQFHKRELQILARTHYYF